LIKRAMELPIDLRACLYHILGKINLRNLPANPSQ
jgi:hypothetical protein